MTAVRLVPPDPLDNPISLGTSDNGITLSFAREASHVLANGRLEINVWDGVWTEAAAVTLDADHALTLAQWINHQLGRD